MRIPFLILAVWALACMPARAEQPKGQWQMTLELDGPGVLDAMVLETVVDFRGSKRLRGSSVSTAPLRHKAIFSEAGRAEPSLTIDVRRVASGQWIGELKTVLGEAALELSLQDQVINGSFEGDIKGKLSGMPFEGDLPLRDYAAVLEQIDSYTKAWIYDGRLTQSGEWAAFHDRLELATAAAQDDFDMIRGFQRSWRDGLFSHYELMRPMKSYDDLIQQADEGALEKPVVHFSFTDDNIAIIIIDSFFGAKIEQQIDSAFWMVAKRNPKALIIDVRENGGGTLAAWPVAARIVQNPALAGFFISNRWWAGHDDLPDNAFLDATASPEVVTTQAFAQDLFSDGVLVMRINPAEETYDGPVYALVSERSRSATEALIGVLQYLDRVEVVGETSAGYMLNSNLFEIAGGFTLRIPVADFFLPDQTSLEGVGVTPDIEVAPSDALDLTLGRIRQTDAP